MTSLLYYRARWYDPQLGRFVSDDPEGFNGGDINFYAYVTNNPTDRVDPSGLWATNVHKEIISEALAASQPISFTTVRTLSKTSTATARRSNT